jgi:hypothetical protein
VFPNPDNGYGFSTEKFELNGELFYLYTQASGKPALAKLVAGGYEFIRGPEDGLGFHIVLGDTAYFSYFSPEDNATMLVKFDGKNFRKIRKQESCISIFSNLVLFNNQVYFVAQCITDRFLARVDDTVVMPLRHIPENANIANTLAVHDNKIWFTLWRGIDGEISYLSNFDGDSIRYATPNMGKNFMFRNPISFKGKLCFKQEKAQYATFHFWDSGQVKQVPLPAPATQTYVNAFEDYLVVEDKLYLSMILDGYCLSSGIASFDGDKLEWLNLPSLMDIQSPAIRFRNTIATWSFQIPYNLMILSDTVAQTACSGATVSIGSNSLGTTFQWQIFDGNNFANISDNSIYQNTTTRFLTLVAAPTATAANLYRCLIDGKPSAVYRLRFENRWLVGPALERNWNTPNFWSCGVVPDQFTDVVIPFGNIRLSNNTTVRSLRLAENAMLKIAPGIQLSIRN